MRASDVCTAASNSDPVVRIVGDHDVLRKTSIVTQLSCDGLSRERYVERCLAFTA